MSSKRIQRVNLTEQGTGVNLEKSARYRGDIADAQGNPVEGVFTPNHATNAFTKAQFSNNIQCCYKIPEVIDSTPPDEGESFTHADITTIDTSNYCRFTVRTPSCENKYEYLHPCECPVVRVWEYGLDDGTNRASGTEPSESKFYKRDNYEYATDKIQTTLHSPTVHPSAASNGSNAITDAMIGDGLGSNGLYTVGSQVQDAGYRGFYSLRCESLNIGCGYMVAVSFSIQHTDDVGGSTNICHYGAHKWTFTATQCVNYIGGQQDGGNNATIPTETDPATIKAINVNSQRVDGRTGSQLIMIPEAVENPSGMGGSHSDTTASQYYVNISAIYIQMNCVPKGRGESFAEGGAAHLERDPIAAP